MLRSINEIIGYGLKATDGDIGKVIDFYFDDLKWTMRYLVADTGKWLPGRKVLVSPRAIGEYDWLNGRKLPVLLAKKQIENSPRIESDAPVSHQKRKTMAELFSWTIYWRDHIIANVPDEAIASAAEYVSGPEGDPHLRSVGEVSGYHIQATDDAVGHVENFIAETDDWRIRYMVVDTRNWLPGKKVLVAPDWIGPVNWKERNIVVDMPSQQIKDSPEFDPTTPVNRDYENRLYDYYGRPVYWEK
jgi:hypothetical protein